MNDQRKETIARTPVAGCAACREQRVHTDEDWKNHPYRGHGYTREHGWSHRDLERIR